MSAIFEQHMFCNLVMRLGSVKCNEAFTSILQWYIVQWSYLEQVLLTKSHLTSFLHSIPVDLHYTRVQTLLTAGDTLYLPAFLRLLSLVGLLTLHPSMYLPHYFPWSHFFPPTPSPTDYSKGYPFYPRIFLSCQSTLPWSYTIRAGSTAKDSSDSDRGIIWI